MALGTNKGGKPAIWLQINGKTGEMARWIKAQGDVAGHEEIVHYVTGHVTGLALKEKEWPGGDKSWVVHLRMKDAASGDRYVLEMGASSRATTQLLGKLNNADLTKEIYLRPYMLKQGEKLQSGEEVKVDTMMYAVKEVLGSDGDKLELGESIRAFYGDKYGDKMPPSVPVMNNGKPVMVQGRQVYDHSEREALTAELFQVVEARLIQDQAQGQTNSHGGEPEDGMDPDEVAQAANQVMRARG